MKQEFRVNPTWEEVVDITTATADVEAFIAGRDYEPSRLKAVEPLKEKLIEATQYGYLIFNEDGSITQLFRNPLLDIKEEKVVKDGLTYKARVKNSILNEAVAKLQTYNQMAHLMAYCSLHTGVSVAVLNNIGDYDSTILTNVTTLFF